MHKTILKQGNASLIAGVLVVLAIAGLCKLLWLAFSAPFLWVVVIAWMVVPLFPFVIRFFTIRPSSSNQGMDGLC
jgi:cyanate permease